MKKLITTTAIALALAVSAMPVAADLGAPDQSTPIKAKTALTVFLGLCLIPLAPTIGGAYVIAALTGGAAYAVDKGKL